MDIDLLSWARWHYCVCLGLIDDILDVVVALKMAVAVLSSMALSINTDRNCHGTLVGKLILPARSGGKEFEVSKMAIERVVLYLFLSYNDVKMALGSKSGCR